MALPQARLDVIARSLSIVLFLTILPLANSTQQQLTSDPSSLHFEKVVVGKIGTLPVTVANTGSTSVTILSARTTNAAFALSGLILPVTLEAGQKITFGVTFSPRHTGNAGGRIVFGGDVPNAWLNVPANGVGVNDWSVTASPSSLQFGSVRIGNKATLPLSIINSGGSSAVISAGQLSGADFAVTGVHLPLTLDPGQSYTFNVTFAPHISGVASGAILATAPLSPLLNVPLLGSGNDTGQLIVSPASVNFGNVTLGTSANQTAILSAVGTSVNVSAATSDNPAFVISGLTLPRTIQPGENAAFTIVFTPQSSGNTSGTLSFVSDAPNSPTLQAVGGNGISPAGHKVTLSWDPSVSQVVGYNVYRSGLPSGPYTRINGALDPNTSYADTTIASGQTYYYVTTAVDSSSQESAFSNQVEAVIP